MVKGAKDSSLSSAFYTPGTALLSCFQSLLVGWKAGAVTAGELSWAQLAELLCGTAHSPWQAAQGARVARAVRLKHRAEECTEPSPVKAEPWLCSW